MIQATLLEIGIAAAIGVAIFGTTWFAAKSHYEAQMDTLKGQLTQEAKDQQKLVDEKEKENNYVTKTVNDEAVAQIGTMSSTISDLLLQHNAISTSKMPSNTCTATTISEPSVGQGTTASTGQDQRVAQSVIDTKELIDILQLTKDSLTAEQLWREWAKGVK